MASYFSSSTCLKLNKKYEVFISFRGEDIRMGFLSHLHEALLRYKICTFVDEKLDRGEDISSSLLETIEGSSVSIIIFSENYAYSPWCLDELAKILECKKTMGQIVLPIFYRVDPTHVQELTGSFGDAIAKHREELRDSLGKVESWCEALKEIAGTAGLVSQDIKPDSKLIERTINCVMEKLHELLPSEFDDEGLVGIESRVKDVKSLLCLESTDLCVVGFWGMGGIGKTTIAEKVFNQISGHFSRRCFVANVREKFEKSTPDCVQREILCQLFGIESSNAGMTMILPPYIRKRLSQEKVLIVLDDVSDLKQIELSIGKHVTYGPGSRIIMTSRDKQLLSNGDAKIYEVEKLNDLDARCLFCLHAFKRNIPDKEYEVLSYGAVDYAQGIPLALKVLGSNLHKKSVDEWKDELEKLKGTSDEMIRNILRRSYDGLSSNEKEIFLDIACLFKGEDRHRVENLLDVPGSKIGISRLIDKSLVSIANKKLHMHDLIQQMGKDIICEEKEVGKRRWLWHPKEASYVLTRARGSGAVKGISLNMLGMRRFELNPTAFERMYNLGFLKFYYPHSYNPINNEIKILLPEGLIYIPDQLRFIYWDQYPLECFPLSFCAENLIELHMRYSKLKELCNEVEDLENLRHVDLSYSKDLKKISGLSRAPNLEVLNLSFCESLVEISSSLQHLTKLTKLDLVDCTSVCDLPSFLHLKGLEFLSLSGCSNITELPEIPCNIKVLDISKNAIGRVPSSIGSLPFLSILKLDSCKRLESLPDSICDLKSLKHLSINGCVNLHGLPGNLGDLESLEIFEADSSGIQELPDSICNLKHLGCLRIYSCVNLITLPENLGNLQSLEVLLADHSGIKELPNNISDLKKLFCLSVRGCVNLHNMPENINVDSTTRIWPSCWLYFTRGHSTYHFVSA